MVYDVIEYVCNVILSQSFLIFAIIKFKLTLDAFEDSIIESSA